MGRAKAWAMEQEERGFYEIEGNICSNCLSNPTLKELVQETASSHKCDFCGAKSEIEIAAPLDCIMETIMLGLTFDWSTPDDEGVSYESAEGGYQASLSTTYDILADYEITENNNVFQAMIESINNYQWVERDYFIGTEDKRYKWAWEEFCREVIHNKRFLFLHSGNDSSFYPEIRPSHFLFELADYKNNRLEDVNLIREVTRQVPIFRVRIGSEKYSTAQTLGAPPVEFAIRSNRMSPAGIPMFYGAFDWQTAVKETYDPELETVEQKISGGLFRPLRTLRLLDLSALPSIPDVFEIERHHLICPLRFFHAFARDIAKPVARNGREHIEYVPTQVVTEFFRHIYRTGGGKKLDGIVYNSSKNRGGEACVLFCENHHACSPEQKPQECILQLEEVLELPTPKD